MITPELQRFIQKTVGFLPQDWVKLTTHRLDIYNESLAKSEFLDHFEKLNSDDVKDFKNALDNLPTAFDYIRLGHPLSCILEWTLAKTKGLGADDVITFSSKMMPILAILRKNSLSNKSTTIFFIMNLFQISIVF